MDKRIGFGMRLAAILIDWVIVVVISFVSGPIIGGVLGAMAAGGSAAMSDGRTAGEQTAAGAAVGGIFGAILGIVAAYVVVSVFYFGLEAFTGWTPGKLLLGIRIANEDGSRARLSTLLGRYAIKNIGTVLGVLALVTGLSLLQKVGSLGAVVILIGCLFALGTTRQALHDKLVRTAVFPKDVLTD